MRPDASPQPPRERDRTIDANLYYVPVMPLDGEAMLKAKNPPVGRHLEHWRLQEQERRQLALAQPEEDEPGEQKQSSRDSEESVAVVENSGHETQAAE